jgi:hypothetical protein
MLLLSDGTVMAQGGSNSNDAHWYKLTPDSTGSYVNGTWSNLASFNDGRRFYASDVLRDGRVFVAGGEYSSVGGDTNTTEIYDPVANTWTLEANYPLANLGDSISAMMPDGRVLAGSQYSSTSYLYNPSSNTWSTTGPSELHGDNASEEGWVKLADGSMLTYAIQGSQSEAGQRLVQGTTEEQSTWVDAGNVPVALESNGGNNGIVPELGPGLLLPNGKVFWIGASGHTATYTPPSGNNTTGTWTQGPDILDNNNTLLGGFDAPAAVETNGKVLLAAGVIDGNNFPGPTTIFEYDPNANTMTQVTAAGPNLTAPVFWSRMLALPSGQVLFSSGNDNTLYVYNPDSGPSSSWAPTISSITWNGGSSFTLTGTQLNGLSEGAAYGDDAQMASNYPIVKLTDVNGKVSFAKTTNWSSTWVATGSTPESTNFTLPGGDGPGVYTVSVIANGIASTPVVVVFGSGADTVTLNTTTGFFGLPVVTIDLNGTTHDYYQFGISGVDVLTEGGTNSVNVQATLAGTPTVVNDGGTDTVTIGSNAPSLSGTLANIAGPVNVATSKGDTGTTTLNVDDSGDSSPQTATITSSSITGLAPAAINYSGVSTLTIGGGSGGNTFNVQSTASGTTTNLDSGTGKDAVNVQETFGPLNVNGENGTDTVILGSLAPSLGGTLANITGPVSVANTKGTTALTVDDSGDSSPKTAVTITSGSITGLAPATISYANLSSLTVRGGSGGNTFSVQSTPASTTLDSGTGNDAVNVQGTVNPLAIQGQQGNDTVVIGSLAPSLGGTLANITGPVSVANTKGTTALTVDDSGDSSPKAAVTITSGSITGLAPATISYANLSSLTVRGGSGGNTFTVVSLPAPTTLKTGAGTDQVNLQATAGSLVVDGQGGTNTLVGPNVAETWSITGANAGSVGIATFSSIQNLTGGSAADTFKFSDGKGVTGVVDGGGGTNTLDYSLYSSPVTVNLATNTATGTGGFAHIQKLVGSTSAADKLIGPNATNTWSISGSNSGTVGSFSFSSIENLTGGTGNDTFQFASGGSVTGTIDGGGGVNTLDYSGDGGIAATVNLASGTATKTGGFAHIQKLVGSTSAADKLIGPNATNTWSITAVNGGTVGSFSFSGVENLTGGNGLDVFVFGAGKSVSGKIDGGGGGNDWLDYAAYTTPVTVNLTTNTATGVFGGASGGIAHIRNVRGGQGGNTLTGNALGNILIGGAGPNTIVGGTGRSLLIGGKGPDKVTGGSGSDILIAGYTDYDSSSLAHDLALESILAEWQSADTYGTRITKIKAGLPGGYKLVWGVTVHDNAITNANTLTGTGGGGLVLRQPGPHEDQ